MQGDPASGAPPSLLGTTIRRSVVVGRVYLVVGTLLSIFYSVVLSLASGDAFATAGPLLLPILAVVGGLGGLLVFTNDRLKGVLEYLIAYGYAPRSLFLNVVGATIVLVSIVLASSTVAGIAAFVATGHAVTVSLVAALAIYTVPMSYASASFAATAGIFWTSLSSPREGMNSPIGLIPVVGVAPPLLTLVAVSVADVTGAVPILATMGLAVGIVVAIVAVLLAFMSRLMHRERLLSPT
ncbi:MAG TPA: hypothetical protein VMH78_03995 [Thermoplasmata archaeon]|nr:hypothetical protein [Thermoplasmata archaeon]